MFYQVDGHLWRVIEAHYPIGVIERPYCLSDKVDADIGDSLVCSVEHPDMPGAAESVLAFAKRQVGKPYDLQMVARFISRQQEARETSGKWFCSELVYAAFWYNQVDLLADTQPWEVSPGLLRRSPYLHPTSLL